MRGIQGVRELLPLIDGKTPAAEIARRLGAKLTSDQTATALSAMREAYFSSARAPDDFS